MGETIDVWKSFGKYQNPLVLFGFALIDNGANTSGNLVFFLFLLLLVLKI